MTLELLSLKQQLLKGGAGSVLVKATFAFLSFTISVVLARYLGAEGFGVYAFIIALIMLISIPAVIGVPELIVRETAKYQAKGNWELIAGLWLWGSKVVISFSVAVLLTASLVIFSFADYVDEVKSQAVLISVLIIPLAAVVSIKSASIRGLRHTVLGQLPDSIIRPFMFLILILVAPFFIKTLGVIDVFYAYIFSVVIALIASLFFLKKVKPVQIAQVTTPDYDIEAWKKSVLPLALISGLHVINGYVDILILGLFRGDEEVGVYRAVVQMSLLVSFGLQAINQVLHPHFSRLYTLGDHQKLQTIVTISARVILLISLPPVVLFVFYGADILGMIFGDPFYVGGMALAILAFGQLVNALMGSVGALLNMTGHERYTVRGVALAAVVNIVLNFALIPFYGMLGAAIATAVSLAMWNLLLRYYVRQKLNIEPSALFKSTRLKLN
ncbi:MAG: flippase [Methyloprofundus sp.]|nr:flippase [Methyloprofundus sp.]